MPKKASRPAPTGKASGFASAAEKDAKAVAAAQQAKDNRGGTPDIPKGVYNCQLSKATASVSAKGVPMFAMNFIVKDGPHKGTSIRRSDWLGDHENYPVEQRWEELYVQFQRLGYDTSSMTAEDVEELAAILSEKKPEAQVYYSGLQPNKKDPTKEPNANVSVNKLIEKGKGK